MYAARLLRPTPYVDKTVYTGWNGLCISAYLEAAKVLHLASARDFALRSLDRILASALKPDGGLLHVMQSEPTHHNIELACIEGQILRVASAKRNISNAMFCCPSTGNGQHCFRKIHSHNFARVFCKRLRDVSRPSSNV